MKTSRPSLQSSEECGVWLDTLDLKVKSKKKKQVRPISKLLNPLARHGGYSLAVALNFTQTKIQMPSTKQSSISSFFSPHGRAVNKLNAERNMEPADTLSSTATGCTSTSANLTSGTKRKRGMNSEQSGVHNTEVFNLHRIPEREDIGYDWSRESINETETSAWQKEAIIPPEDMVHASEVQAEEKGMAEPKRKREFCEPSPAAMDTGSLEEQCSEDLWSTCSSPQYSQDLTESDNHQHYLSHDSKDQYVLTQHEPPTARHGSSVNIVSESQLSEVGFGVRLCGEGRTSTQRRSFLTPWISQEGEEKENHPLSSHTSSSVKTVPCSPLRSAALTFQNRLTKANIAPQKPIMHSQLRETETEEDTQAMLFTQDSEGFKVIAHRGHSLLARRCLTDQTNTAWRRDSRVAPSVALELEKEMLFTQDSQGNVVIKHWDLE